MPDFVYQQQTPTALGVDPQSIYCIPASTSAQNTLQGHVMEGQTTSMYSNALAATASPTAIHHLQSQQPAYLHLSQHDSIHRTQMYHQQQPFHHVSPHVFGSADASYPRVATYGSNASVKSHSNDQSSVKYEAAAHNLALLSATTSHIYSAVYSGVPVYEMMCHNVAVMRRRYDSYLNATQILKVAGIDKGRRTKILEREILQGEHEKVQGGYGKYQGTW